jgi:hypothetical protein
MLDKRSADIAKALADAARLREEAMKARQDAERTLGQADRRGRGHHPAQAREEAEPHAGPRRPRTWSTAVALREQQALDRIAQSEVPPPPRRCATPPSTWRCQRHPSAAARAGRLGPQCHPGRRGDRGAAAPPALSFGNFPDRPHTKQSRATWQPPSQGGGFFLCMSSPVFGGGYRRGNAPSSISPISDLKSVCTSTVACPLLYPPPKTGEEE